MRGGRVRAGFTVLKPPHAPAMAAKPATIGRALASTTGMHWPGLVW